MQKYPTAEDKATTEFDLNNNLMQPAPLSTTDQIILDKPFLLVNEKEIRLKWVNGWVSLIWIEIVPLNAPPEKGGPTTYLANNSKMGANCFK